MRSLNGADLASFIKERQARAVRTLVAGHVAPRLAIVRTNRTPVTDMYMKLKERYGADIGVTVEVHATTQGHAADVVLKLNADPKVHGIIIQLPLAQPEFTEQLVNMVAPIKDVDGLGEHAAFDPGTPTAINWLLAGYNVELRQKKIVIVGQGRLVGAPLASMFRDSGLDVATADINTADLPALTRTADVLVTATGQPGLIQNDMVKPGAVVVDAGVATDAGHLVGDVAPDVRERDDLTITPLRGGVGPLTVSALFENVLSSARDSLARVDAPS